MGRLAQGSWLICIFLLWGLWGLLLISYWLSKPVLGIEDPIPWTILIALVLFVLALGYTASYKFKGTGEPDHIPGGGITPDEKVEKKEHDGKETKLEEKTITFTFKKPKKGLDTEGRKWITYPPKVPNGIFMDCKFPVGKDLMIKLRVFAGQLCRDCPHKAFCVHRDYRTVIMDNPCLLYKETGETKESPENKKVSTKVNAEQRDA